MFRLPITPRPHWQTLAKACGFGFHTMYGEPYWDESAYYQFTLKQIEQDLEAPTEELHQMCLYLVDKVIADEALLKRLALPELTWDAIATSWKQGAPSLYSRFDLAYDGKSPAKLLENNADTPTSLYEAGFWQWLWLEDQMRTGVLSPRSDQFNSLQDKLIARLAQIRHYLKGKPIHFSCASESVEDRATVQYLEDCANDAGCVTGFVDIDDIRVNKLGQIRSADNQRLSCVFKLYPWEWLLNDQALSPYLSHPAQHWLEPMWKSILSNKGILPLLWQWFPKHPNLLPCYFADDPNANRLSDYVIKPFFSREGANISIIRDQQCIAQSDGPYTPPDQSQQVIQQFHPLPKFGDNHTLIGSWLVNDQAAGIGIREDRSLITQDLSRFVPHIILS